MCLCVVEAHACFVMKTCNGLLMSYHQTEVAVETITIFPTIAGRRFCGHSYDQPRDCWEILK